ncbi:hypothetical protein VM1G_07052 [Cytospora mali]|uniref:Uncharacterized protein n=1 Tax=Cytospora mali TaxID=578113 RepID=A0A194W457_CYTMA|nr:hypothetical protein VM1G_07052 [Valsa mali]
MNGDTMDTNNKNPSPFMKLFGDDPDGEFQKIRNKIYSYVWSRDRRDEGKLDWVLSQNGINRNVPERFIEGTPYESVAFKSIRELPCWLILANKEISADFTRYIYSINDLEVDVDLKANHTAQSEAHLSKIITLLQNPNFVRYTQNLRVRIHFPDKYPFQDLPSFNRHALEGIATTLNGFEQLKHLVVRIVPMQGPRDYELRLAAFPFYPMSLTNWSIHMFNDTTSNWDIVSGEQIHRLNLAWTAYQATGSLTAKVNSGGAEKNEVSGGQSLDGEEMDNLPKEPVAVLNKNGSQKRKSRKMRAVSAMATSTRSASATPSVAASSRLSSPDPAPVKTDGASPSSGMKLPGDRAPSRFRSSDFEPFREPSDNCSSTDVSVISAAGLSPPPSPPQSPVKNLVTEIPAKPSEVSPDKRQRTAITPPTPKVDSTAKSKELTEFMLSQTSKPPSPASSSATLGRSQDGFENLPTTAGVSDGAIPTADGVDSKEPLQKKKRRNRKKSKKPKVADSANTSVECAEDQMATAGVQLNEGEGENDVSPPKKAGITEEQLCFLREMEGLQRQCGHTLWYATPKQDIPLSELADIKPYSASHCLAVKADGSHYIIYRTQEVNRYLRQQERIAASELEKDAQRMKTKEKRQSKKVKEVLIRRRGPLNNLRREAEDTKQPKAGKDSNNLEKIVKESGNNEFDNIDYDDECYPRVEEPICHDYLDPQSQYGHPQSSQSAAGTPIPVQAPQNHTNLARNMPTKDEAFALKGQNTQALMGQELRTLDVGHTDMNALVKDNWVSTNTDNRCQHVTDSEMQPVHENPALFANATSMEQGHLEYRRVEGQHHVKDIDDPDYVNSLAAQCSDNDGLSVCQDNGETNDQAE